jgi:hypothetical protein
MKGDSENEYNLYVLVVRSFKIKEAVYIWCVEKCKTNYI